MLTGLGFLFGGLIGVAAFFALLMNFAFLFAGTTSSNPLLIMLEVVVLWSSRVAGWWGMDRFLLPRLAWPAGRLRRRPEHPATERSGRPDRAAGTALHNIATPAMSQPCGLPF